MRTQPATSPAPAAVDDGEPRQLSQSSASSPQLIFKKHKVLPHPRKEASYAGLRGSRSEGPLQGLGSALSSSAAPTLGGALPEETSSINSQPSTPRTKKQYPKTLGRSLDLPPTPPAHSRNSSSTYSVPPSTATYVHSPERSAEDMLMKDQPMLTPTKQLSPPTPEGTPPHEFQSELRSRRSAFRSPLRDCDHLKHNTEVSKTAPGKPSSSPWADGDVFSSPLIARARENIPQSTSHRTIEGSKEQVNESQQGKHTHPGLFSYSASNGSTTTKPEYSFLAFDGRWGTTSEVAAKEWDGHLPRNAIVQDRDSNQTAKTPDFRVEETQCAAVLPTVSTKLIRSTSLPQRILASTTQSGQPDYQRVKSQPQSQHQQHQTRELLSTEALSLSAQMAQTLHSTFNYKGAQNFDALHGSTDPTGVKAAGLGSPPQRRRTLRHVKKKDSLRGLDPGLSTSSSEVPLLPEQATQQRWPNDDHNSSHAYGSARIPGAINIMSRSARREIWKTGAIPVAIVPGRQSSARLTFREPSLRSTSSRRSRPSEGLRPDLSSQNLEYSELRGRRSRACSESAASTRGNSARDGSAPGDQRTIDFPPPIPKRSSSLSAPTSRNVSRTGSLTAESDHAYAAILRSHLEKKDRSLQGLLPSESSLGQVAQPYREVRLPVRSKASGIEPSKASESIALQSPDVAVLCDVNFDRTRVSEQNLPARPAFSASNIGELRKNNLDVVDGDSSNDDQHADSAPRSHLDRRVERDRTRYLSPHNTPFSVASVETTTTHHSLAEVSEALAVSIYAHQNTSILVVDHSTRHSDSPISSQDERWTDIVADGTARALSSPSLISTTELAPSPVCAPSNQPSTSKTVYDIETDIPVEALHDKLSNFNSRSPPELPAIQLIPATPSGLTTSTERDIRRDNHSSLSLTSRPRRRRSVSAVFRRALSHGRSTSSGSRLTTNQSGNVLTRSFSLTNKARRRASLLQRSDSKEKQPGRFSDVEPAEESKLHPFWRPASPAETDDVDDHDGSKDENAEVYRYPPIDNRPIGPRRSLKSRMKKTFAILPSYPQDDIYPATSDDGPERCTVRRTPSGNLRVVKHHGRTESPLSDYRSRTIYRPYTAPERQYSRKLRFWRSFPVNKAVADQT